MRTIRRFTKPGHVAEIRERSVTHFEAIEWLMFVDGHLLESRLYHRARVRDYASELEEACASLRSKRWAEDQTARPPSQ